MDKLIEAKAAKIFNIKNNEVTKDQYLFAKNQIELKIFCPQYFYSLSLSIMIINQFPARHYE